MLLIPLFFFFNDTATTEIYTLSLHDALPIWPEGHQRRGQGHPRFRRRHEGDRRRQGHRRPARRVGEREDRKSTRLNSSHPSISYAVFCLKKKKKKKNKILKNKQMKKK